MNPQIVYTKMSDSQDISTATVAGMTQKRIEKKTEFQHRNACQTKHCISYKATFAAAFTSAYVCVSITS